jgi:hypothetical protein
MRRSVRTSCKQEGNTKINVRETLCEVVDWIKLAQEMIKQRISVTTVMNF